MELPKPPLKRSMNSLMEPKKSKLSKMTGEEVLQKIFIT